MKTLAFIALLFAVGLPLNVRLTVQPDDYQLYPRASNNMGTVVFQGKVLEAGADSVFVKVTRNSKPVDRVAVGLVYQGDSADFNIAIPIPAELAEYGFECRVDADFVAKADSVVAGDVYLIGGQSNSVAIANSEWREYVRGVHLAAADTGWGLAKDGTWGMEVGRLINEHYGIPACVMNGGVSGAGIGTLQRDNLHPMDPNNAYGRTLFRAFRGGVQNYVKAIFWYQGETDAGYGAETSYPGSFGILRQSWMEDYPSIQKIYLFQINCWLTNGSREMREAHRRISHLYDNVDIMSTIGSPTYGGHYEQPGYFELGERIFRLVARDFYGSRDTLDVAPPEVVRAYYADANKDRVIMDFNQAVHWTGRDTAGYSLKEYFALNDNDWLSGDSCWFENDSHRIVLKLKAASTATTISYINDWYAPISSSTVMGPCLMNRRNVGAVTFAKFPLDAPAPTDTALQTGLLIEAPKASLSLFEAEQLLGIASYNGGYKDTNRNVSFSTADTFVVRLEENGFVRAVNPGMAEIIAAKGGILDTVTLTVGTGFTALHSMGFGTLSRAFMKGDSLAPGLLGEFEPAGSGLFNLDTFAVFEFDTAVLAQAGGWLKAKQTAVNIPVVASFAGERCTLLVSVDAVPSFVKRINFQPKGMAVTTIPDWSIDSGSGYSAAAGFGWITPNPSSQNSPNFKNYLKATWAWHDITYSPNSNRYRIDCPNGNYLIRLCVSQYLWQKPGTVVMGTDTLVKNPQDHAGDGIATELQIWYADRRITVSGDTGIRLTIYGGIAYLVLISDDGADLNLASKDGDVAVQPKYYTGTEETNEENAAVLREPQSYPNPFNPTTTVRFAMPAGVSADYALYDIRGRLVLAIPFGRSSVAQVRRMTIDFNTLKGGGKASGTYFGRLMASDGRRFTHTLVLVR